MTCALCDVAHYHARTSRYKMGKLCYKGMHMVNNNTLKNYGIQMVLDWY